MKGCRFQVGGRPRQCSNISAMVSWRTVCKQQCRLPARQIRICPWNRGWYSSLCRLQRDELPIWELMPEPVVMGLGWGRIIRDRQQIDCGSILYPSQRDHGLTKEEGEGWEGGGGRCLASLMRLHQLKGSWLTLTHPHKDTVDSQVICLVIEKI